MPRATEWSERYGETCCVVVLSCSHLDDATRAFAALTTTSIVIVWQADSCAPPRDGLGLNHSRRVCRQHASQVHRYLWRLWWEPSWFDTMSWCYVIAAICHDAMSINVPPLKWSKWSMDSEGSPGSLVLGPWSKLCGKWKMENVRRRAPLLSAGLTRTRSRFGSQNCWRP
ncbi:uncharacterized protein K460DRAFT_103856 [Cucurbitaria berberidis CBS 394.84]|uniref:Uncharacterized protein n=1 Tax=Cucurbitaria berberidis CBS 394.84 TaxID=1168544 RepID=A0A9P4GHA1_9PLEO|nr:uncharacterized protein K460DRAFT_103856 [Cucurbitaria berberidis CBS 394.84]KAF1845140.1 hypothetical protein K460DRAFT_103856 [Cucurbitaria berberidis CBS 394.84]